MPGTDHTPESNVTIIAPGRASYLLVWTGFPLLGAAAGALLKWIARWAASLPWIPFQGPLELLDSLPPGPATFGAAALGTIVGLAIAYFADTELLRVAVSDDSSVIGEGKARHHLGRPDVTAVFVEHKELIVLGTATEELVRVKSDMGKSEIKQLASAFTEHGWPWHGTSDPHEADYRRWVPDTPDLPATVNAVFAARAKALSDDDSDDAKQLRDELARLGFAVRDDGKRQFWRALLTGPSP